MSEWWKGFMMGMWVIVTIQGVARFIRGTKTPRGWP